MGSPLLAVLILGVELLVIGVVGTFAATPPAASTAPVYQQGNGTAIAVFSAPNLAWGQPSLTVSSTGGPPCGSCVYSMPPPLTSVSIASCLESSCQEFGEFRAHLLVGGIYAATVLVPSRAQVFLLTVSYPAPVVLVVSMQWSDSLGLPEAGTPMGAMFTALFVGGWC